ncbi:hypothetical protein [Paucisalibacillus globulus]|nr:hypothetical protein [Paucisalibacillus globulus]
MKQKLGLKRRDRECSTSFETGKGFEMKNERFYTPFARAIVIT